MFHPNRLVSDRQAVSFAKRIRDFAGRAWELACLRSVAKRQQTL
jgi:hypothetical protein